MAKKKTAGGDYTIGDQTFRHGGTKRPGGRVDVPVWSAFCEALGTRCTVIVDGVRCDGGVTVGDRCAAHQTEGGR